MYSTGLFLFLASMLGLVQSQTWAGTYTTDNTCPTSSCCCLSGQVVVASASANTYSVNSPVSGVCSGATTYSGTLYTSGFAGWMIVISGNNTVTLSSDSKVITVINWSNPLCSGLGTKSAGDRLDVNIFKLLILSVISMMMSFLFF
ncbi:unnamed protein product [Adineta ricciae]|uniref:Uncharacterized protein n=1 Tax=Adineta ricciae TaxID=249248 RepID=A0A813UUJ1_ADIRI|nr:unnamed protein product [Adineta ricciae]CAF1438236.1 unnamed protein product [Adineta ricciae]